MMTLSFRRLRAGLCAAVLVLVPYTAWAGKIEIKNGAGNIPALLEPDAAIYADAVRGLLAGERPVLIERGKFMRDTRAKVRGATVARIEYSYKKDGKTHTRIYHARSGHSIQETVDRLSARDAKSSGQSESTVTESGEETGAPVDDVLRDAAEQVYYPPDTEIDVRAPNLPEENSILESWRFDEQDHSWDAELKAFRKIEADIADGTVTEGGKVIGYVSKTVCPSCEKVINTFADEFKADGAIYQLIEPSVGQNDFSDPKIGASQKASSELATVRKAYADRHLARGKVKAPDVKRWADPVSVRRLEAEEAGLALEEAEACAP